jgi:hypothetical protein
MRAFSRVNGRETDDAVHWIGGDKQGVRRNMFSHERIPFVFRKHRLLSERSQACQAIAHSSVEDSTAPLCIACDGPPKSKSSLLSVLIFPSPSRPRLATDQSVPVGAFPGRPPFRPFTLAAAAFAGDLCDAAMAAAIETMDGPATASKMHSNRMPVSPRLLQTEKPED